MNMNMKEMIELGRDLGGEVSDSYSYDLIYPIGLLIIFTVFYALCKEPIAAWAAAINSSSEIKNENFLSQSDLKSKIRSNRIYYYWGNTVMLSFLIYGTYFFYTGGSPFVVQAFNGNSFTSRVIVLSYGCLLLISSYMLSLSQGQLKNILLKQEGQLGKWVTK